MNMDYSEQVALKTNNKKPSSFTSSICVCQRKMFQTAEGNYPSLVRWCWTVLCSDWLRQFRHCACDRKSSSFVLSTPHDASVRRYKLCWWFLSVRRDDNALLLQRAESLVTPSDANADGYTRADCKCTSFRCSKSIYMKRDLRKVWKCVPLEMQCNMSPSGLLQW